MDSVRAFIAIDLPEDVRRELRRQIDRLREGTSGIPVRWVRPEGIHLTLRFLGDTGLDVVPELKRDLEGLGAAHHVFTIRIGGLGCFPNDHKPRVIWVAVKEETGALNRLQHGVEAVCRQLGYPAERRAFSPHLTLGRVRQGGEAETAVEFARFVTTEPGDPLGQAMVEEVVLFQSELKPEGAVYRRLASVGLSSE